MGRSFLVCHVAVPLLSLPLTIDLDLDGEFKHVALRDVLDVLQAAHGLYELLDVLWGGRALIFVNRTSIFGLVVGCHQEVPCDGVGFLVRFGRSSLLLPCLLGLLRCLLPFQVLPFSLGELEYHNLVTGHRANW